MSKLSDAAALIQRSQRIAVSTHVTPDADAIGSLLGLGLSLELAGKQALLLCDDPVPRALAFLPGSDAVQISLPDDFTADLLISLDASDTERLGTPVQPLLESGIPVLNIDHHVTNLNYGTVNLVVDNASTAEVLLPLLDALNLPLTQDTATCLLAGVVGDTRSFSTSNVTPETLTNAARLTGAGADLALVTEMIFNRRSYNVLRLWGLGLGNLHLDKNVIWTALSLGSRRRMGLDWNGANGLSSLLISAKEANIAAVFVEQPDNKVDVSLRARPGYDVATVALSLGGGGHPQAAGCVLIGRFTEVTQRVVKLLMTQAAQPGDEAR